VATFKPAVSGDDAGIYGSYFYDTAAQIGIGNALGARHAMIRFPNVTIPVGSVIDTAKLTFNAHQDNAGNDTNVIIYGVAADNPVAPTSVAEFNALTLTTAYVNWDDIENWTQDSNYDTPSIKTIIQEIADRAGWASGNALIMVIKAAELGTNQRWFHAIDESSSVCPILTVTYTTQWGHKINTLSTPAKVYGVSNTAVSYKISKINTVAR
jgi:hypothetical protein